MKFWRLSECCGNLVLEKPTSIPPFPFPHAFGKPRSVHTGIQIPEWTVPYQNRCYLKETKKIFLQNPKPYLKKIIDRESKRRWELYTRAVLCRPDLLGGEEHIARGEVCLCKLQHASRPTDGTLVRTELRMRPLPFLDLSFVPDRKFPPSQQGGTGIVLGRFHWQTEATAPPPCLPLLRHTHISSLVRCASDATLRLNEARILGRLRPSIAL